MTTLGLADGGAFAGSTLTFLNRCRSHGLAVGESGDGFSISACVGRAAAQVGLSPVAETLANPSMHASAPRIAIYAGQSIGYPYWGYYAHALLSIGLGFHAVTGAEVARGCLSDYDLLVMPGGFATWGLDRAEEISGIDAAIGAFIQDGGAYMGSCGGAFYMSQGRPGWHGALDAMPRYTHEYLKTGAGMLGISVDDPVMGRGLPETVEVPYYHGPIYTAGQRAAEPLGQFRTYVCESRLFIENPLSPALFEDEMKGTPAIFMSDFGKGKVLTFSPHPEMGEFVRKGIALQGYVRHFLPIRGFKVMDQTLQFLMKEDCAGFRLIYNAIGRLGLFQADPAALRREPESTVGLSAILEQLDDTMARQFAAIGMMAASEDESMQEIVNAETDRLKLQWSEASSALRQAIECAPTDVSGVHGLGSVLDSAAQAKHADRLEELMVMTELPIRLVAAALRIIACDRALSATEIPR